ncbi:MAG TPA: SRPBCC family protein [Telluria sp.]|nr:SRPBCC family protein [Telluria sp.]
MKRHFKAKPARVFGAWLDPASAGRWLFATPAGTMVQVDIDGRAGGGFTIVDRRDGEDVAHVGKYLEVDRPRRLVFSFGVPKYSKDQAVVAIDFRPSEVGCELTLTQEMNPSLAEYKSRTEEGWATILQNLAKFVE